MGIRQLLGAGIASVFLFGLTALGPTAASATNMAAQQAILLIHVPLGGGSFFTSNYVFAANEGNPVTVNVKCFNESSQRVGPAFGVNVELNATGQLSQQTPTTLGVTTDPLFSGGLGWCFASNIEENEFGFNVLNTIGLTSDLTPGGLLTSPGSTLVAANTGLHEMSNNRGGIPYFDTSGGVSATYVFLLNPVDASAQVTLQLYNAAGVAQGLPLVRSLAARDIDLLSIPSAFGLATPPVSGTVQITANGLHRYLGWIIQVGGSKILFTAIGLVPEDAIPLTQNDAP
jgi:hypothetical protein